MGKSKLQLLKDKVLPKTEREKREAYPVHTSYERFGRKDEGAQRVRGHCPTLEQYDNAHPRWNSMTDRRRLE